MRTQLFSQMQENFFKLKNKGGFWEQSGRI